MMCGSHCSSATGREMIRSVAGGAEASIVVLLAGVLYTRILTKIRICPRGHASPSTQKTGSKQVIGQGRKRDVDQPLRICRGHAKRAERLQHERVLGSLL